MATAASESIPADRKDKSGKTLNKIRRGAGLRLDDIYCVDIMKTPAPPPETTPRKPDEPCGAVLVVGNQGPFCGPIWCQLTALGYHVLTATEVLEAKDVLITHGIQSIGLLIMDLRMPLLGADEFIEWFQKENPRAKLLLTPGCSNTATFGKNCFLQSPFPIETLGGRMHDFLESDINTPKQKAA